VNQQFKKHYTREEAESLLPQIREWLARLNTLRTEAERADKRISSLMQSGDDIGGELVNRNIRTLADIQGIVSEFDQRSILIKDIERGLIDFPAIIGGKEVFLCWENGEENIEFWHDLETGYGGREKI
jgi:hypothetical protein